MYLHAGSLAGGAASEAASAFCPTRTAATNEDDNLSDWDAFSDVETESASTNISDGSGGCAGGSNGAAQGCVSRAREQPSLFGVAEKREPAPFRCLLWPLCSVSTMY